MVSREGQREQACQGAVKVCADPAAKQGNKLGKGQMRERDNNENVGHAYQGSILRPANYGDISKGLWSLVLKLAIEPRL